MSKQAKTQEQIEVEQFMAEMAKMHEDTMAKLNGEDANSLYYERTSRQHEPSSDWR
jgi:hypothetical protein